MMEWDDYYQMMKSKNKGFKVSDGMQNFKQENEAFYKDWSEAERDGRLAYADWDEIDKV